MACILPRLAYLCLIGCLQALPLSVTAQSIAIAIDGAWTADAWSEPGALLMLDRDQTVVRRYPLATLDGKQTTKSAAVHHVGARRSFIVALPGVAELWELSYNPSAEPIYDGYVHDYKMGEGIAKPGFLGIRRTPLDGPLSGLVFDASFRHAIGVRQATSEQPAELQIINLDIRRRIERIALPSVSLTSMCADWQWRDTKGRYCAP